jgi:chaperonin GroES
MTIRPLHDRILVKRLEEETKTAGGLFIPDTAKEKPIQAKVVAVGAGKRDKDGKLHALDVKPGDKVLFSKYSWHRGQDRRRGAPDHARGRPPCRARVAELP